MKILKYKSKTLYINLIFTKEDLKIIDDPYNYFWELYKDEIDSIESYSEFSEQTITNNYTDNILKNYDEEDYGSTEIYFCFSENYTKESLKKAEDLIQQMYDHFLIKKYLCE